MESEGERGRLFPMEQANDIRNGLTLLETNDKVDPERLALFGFSFGGGMVPYVAGVDQRVKCAVSVVGWEDGGRWMRAIRRHGEWLDLLRRIDDDRKARIETGSSELMGRIGGILVGDGCRRQPGLKPVLSVLGPSFIQHVDVGAPCEHGFPAFMMGNHFRRQIELVAE